MAAGKWKLYECAKLAINKGEVNFNAHSFKINLYRSISNADTLAIATITQLSDITSQTLTANGYVQNNKAVTITVTNSAGTITVDETTNPTWTATGGTIVFQYAVIYDDSHASDLPICVCKLNESGNITLAQNNRIEINIDLSGLFTQTGATTD
jgi:glucosamine 6-phosphate synthetase-like amidotransferase/phosphosugar isomerase protein